MREQGVAETSRSNGSYLLAFGTLIVALGISLGVYTDRTSLSWVALTWVVAGLLVLINLRFALYLCVFLIPWQVYLGNWPDSTYTFRFEDILIAWISVITLLRFPKSANLLLSKWLLPFWFFIVIAVSSGLLRGDLYGISKFIIDWLPSLTFYWLLLFWISNLSWRVLLSFFLLSYALQATLGIFQIIISDPQIVISFLQSPIAKVFFDPDALDIRVFDRSLNFIWRNQVFAFGTYLSSSGLGVLLATIGTLCWSFALQARRLIISPNFYLGILFYIVCILTMKRSGWVSLIAGLLTILALNYKDIGRFKIIRLSTILGLIAILISIFSYWQRDTLLDRVTDQFGWEFGRENTWPVYLDLIWKQPVIGYGPSYPQGSAMLGLTPLDYAIGPENTYLHLALTAGLLGEASLLWLVLYMMYCLWRARWVTNRNPVIAVSSGLAAFGIGGIFFIAVGDLQSMGPLLFLLAFAYKHTMIGDLQKVS